MSNQEQLVDAEKGLVSRRIALASRVERQSRPSSRGRVLRSGNIDALHREWQSPRATAGWAPAAESGFEPLVPSPCAPVTLSWR
jgi:hypothetical protein